MYRVSCRSQVNKQGRLYNGYRSGIWVSQRMLTTIDRRYPPSIKHEKYPTYASFLQNSKTKREGNRTAKIYNKSFTQINPESIKPADDLAGETWSSQYDLVTRQPFSRDIGHLQSLLDALLSCKNYERADNILRAIYQLSTTADDFMFAFNKYLEAWSSEPVTILDMEKYLSSMKNNSDKTNEIVVPNDKTYAILISKALQGEHYSSYNRFLNEISSSYKLTQLVLSHVDVLGIDNLTKIFEYPSIIDKHIPPDFLPLYQQIQKNKSDQNQTQNQSSSHTQESQASQPEEEIDYFKDDKTEVPVIEKEAEQLRSVDSFGLKVVRHTLLGLKLSSHERSSVIDNLMNNLEKEVQQDVINTFSTDGKKDYFALYKMLKTDDERKKLNQALDLFNQARQRTIELRGADSAKEKWKHDYEEMMKRGSMHFDKSLNVQLYEWYQQLLPFVSQEVEQCRLILEGKLSVSNCNPHDKALVKERSYYAPYLTLVSPEKMCAVTILELLRLNSTGGVIEGMRTAKALISVGKAVELEYKSQKLMETERKTFSKKSRTAKEWSKIIRLMKSRNKEPDSPTFSEWDSTLHAKVGSILTSLLIHVAKVPVKGTDPTTGKTVTGSQPAFFHTFQYSHGQKVGVLKLHKSVIRQLSSDVNSSLIQPHFLPMLTPPRPWVSYNEGGYLFSQSTLVRTRDSPETIAYLRAASKRGDLEKVFQGLNVLGDTAWTVNRKVLEVMTKFWNSGQEFLDIPPIVDELQLPDPVPSNADPDTLRQYQRKVKLAFNTAASNRSQRCDTNYKLEIARAFIGERMFFPHNIDFRGRAYPISPHFNHLGNDLTRSLFLFWDGKELGEKGLFWLKVHLANLYGFDKAPLHERAQFVDDNIENIKQSSENPIDKDGWWTKGDKPWQVLGVCFEINEAYKLLDPTKYISHVPVHQDGSCNGLQHYAALGGDMEGARQVNLIPADRPQDVYTFVAKLVQKRVDQEAENGDKYALFLQDKITRKVVKQTVMTNVYGVTFIGARDQIRKQLSKYFDKNSSDGPGEYARYLTHHVFGSIRELFEGAHLIQDWLGEAARIISKSVRIDYEETSAANDNKPNHLSSVIWTTPLGLPCVQPYRTSKTQVISTNLQDVAINDPFGASPVDSRKQKTALPPNYVHSLDATHMLMTASSCATKGLKFASVHDSFWTHAKDIDTLNTELREQFVKLHEEDLVEKVKNEFEARYKGFLQVMTIPRDHELCNKILEIRRKIANEIGRTLTVADEIHLEKRRQELLSSDDPTVVEMGSKLVTTVSVTEDYDISSIPQTSMGFQILAPIEFPPIPSKGSLDVGIVKDSRYFFS